MPYGNHPDNSSPTNPSTPCHICGGVNGEHVYEMHRQGFVAPENTNSSSKQVEPELKPCPHLHAADYDPGKVVRGFPVERLTNGQMWCFDCKEFFCESRVPVDRVAPEVDDLPFDDYCAGKDCRACAGVNCTCSCHACAASTVNPSLIQRTLNALEDLRGHFGPGNCWCDGDGSDDSPHLFCCSAVRGLYDELRGTAAASPAPKEEQARDKENLMNTVTFATSANIANPDVSCPKCGGTKPTCCSCPEAKFISMAEFVREFTQAAINAHVGFKHESRWHDCDYSSCSKWREMIDTLNSAATPSAPVISDGDPDA